MNLNEASLRYSVTAHTIKKWIQEGMPCEQIGKGKGTPYIFDMDDCDEWVEDKKNADLEDKRIKEEEESIKSELDADIKKARLRNLNKDYEMKELKVKERAGQLVPIDKIDRQVQDVLKFVRTNLRSIPSKAAPIVSKLSKEAEVKEELQTLIDDILKDMAKGKGFK